MRRSIKRPSLKRQPQPRPAPETALEQLRDKHLDDIRAKNFSEHTITNRRVAINFFLTWCAGRGITEPVEVTRTVLEAYQRHVFHYRKKNSEPLAFTGQLQRLIPLKVWFKWMARNHHILHNPASELEMPKIGFRLPKSVLTAQEAEQILAQPNIHEPLGLRDRAILETLYSTGMRRQELSNLKLWDVDGERETVMIRQGKGKKDRMIPLGRRAADWIAKYMRDARPQLAASADDGTLFLTNAGEPLVLGYLTMLVATYVEASGVKKKGACHLWRHTMATLMLEGGADIRFIQAMLGHSDLKATEIYTHVAIRKLQEIHRATHPANLERDKRALLEAIAAEDDESNDGTL
jgi:integrase/recombinase XerD